MDFSGVTTGLNKGVGYFEDFFKLLTKAESAGNEDEIQDLMDVASQWLKEAAAAKKIYGGNLGVAMLFADPFATSRAMMQQVKAKYK